MIYWLTGQPGAGKTTIANEMIKLQSFKNCVIVDGDDLRELFKNKNYTKLGRLTNINRAKDITKFLNHIGKDVIVSLVSPYRDQREDFKKEMGDQIKEIYIHTNEIRGKEHFHVDYYEPPLENYIDLDTTNKRIIDTLKEVVYKIHYE